MSVVVRSNIPPDKDVSVVTEVSQVYCASAVNCDAHKSLSISHAPKERWNVSQATVLPANVSQLRYKLSQLTVGGEQFRGVIGPRGKNKMKVSSWSRSWSIDDKEVWVYVCMYVYATCVVCQMLFQFAGEGIYDPCLCVREKHVCACVKHMCVCVWKTCPCVCSSSYRSTYDISGPRIW